MTRRKGIRRLTTLPTVAPAMRADVLVERPWWLLGAVGDGVAVVEAVALLMMRDARLGWVQDWG